MTPFTSADYLALHRVVFTLDTNGKPRWPGYRPEVVEIPNGDGRADAQKRYAHIKAEHLVGTLNCDTAATYHAFHRAFTRACEVAIELGIPPAFWPAREACALRVLEYPPMVGGERHTDFDLATINVWRSDGGVHMLAEEAIGRDHRPAPEGVHLGELYDLILPPTARAPELCATAHQIAPSEVSQFALVFFALPSHAAVLPDGRKVGDWLVERYARSRAPKG
jgi:hypothetical protein